MIGVEEEKLEKSNIVRKIINFFFTRILLYLPFDWGTEFFMKSCKGAANLRSWATTWKALEILYNWDPEKSNWKSDFELREEYGNGFFTKLWQKLDNSAAVRNRYKLLKNELKKAVIESRKKVVFQLSLGCGSSRANLETVAELSKECPEKTVKTILADYSRSALNYSAQLAKKLKLKDIVIRRGDVTKIREYTSKVLVDIIEANGILPYLSDIESVHFLENIYRTLDIDGTLITSNTGENFETPFIKKIVGYNSMRVRAAEYVAELVREAGFQQIRIVSEPIGLHSLVVAKKLKKT